MSSNAIRRAAPAAAMTGTVSTAQIFALASNPLLAVTLAAPGKGVLEQKSFVVRAEGNATVAAGATTVKASLYAGLVAPASPLVAANWTLLGAGTARAVAAPGTVPWWIEARLIIDSVSGLMQGMFSDLVNNLFDGSAAIANQITGINGTNVAVGTVVPADPIVVFAVGLTFSATGANSANLANFELAF